MGGLVLQVPGVEDLSAFDTYGVPAILVAVLLTLGFLFYKRIIVWGATCDLLVGNEQEKTARAQKEAEDAKADVRRVAEDSNANMATALKELSLLREWFYEVGRDAR